MSKILQYFLCKGGIIMECEALLKIERLFIKHSKVFSHEPFIILTTSD